MEGWGLSALSAGRSPTVRPEVVGERSIGVQEPARKSFPSLGAFAALEDLFVHGRTDAASLRLSDHGRKSTPGLRILAPHSRETLTRHLSGHWEGRVDAGVSYAPHHPSAAEETSLLRRALLRPCKALFKKIFACLIKCRMRIGIVFTDQERSADLDLAVYLQRWCGRESALVALNFTCRQVLATGATSTVEEGEQTPPAFLSSARTMITTSIQGGGGAGRGSQACEISTTSPVRPERPTSSSVLTAPAESRKRTVFATLLELFGLIESSSPVGDPPNGGDIGARLRHLGWAVSDTPTARSVAKSTTDAKFLRKQQPLLHF